MPNDVAARLGRALERSPMPGMVSVYLFGSQASARAHRDSDVDLGVLLDWAAYPERKTRFEARLRLGADFGHDLGRNDVDIVVLNDAPPQLVRVIVTRGLRLFCADLEMDRAFVRTILSRAADLEPFLRRARRTKLAAVRR